MIIVGYKEDGICRVIRTIGIGSMVSNLSSEISVERTYSRCLISRDGPVIFFAVGWTATAQVIICDPNLVDPGIAIGHAYLRNTLCPHCMEVLKKRKMLGDNDDLDPCISLIVLANGIFYTCDIKTGDVDESDSFVAPEPYDDAAFFGTLGDSDKKGWDLLQQIADADLRQSVNETYPLIRIDDNRYVFEYKLTPESEWEACEK
jgi:hypothetical protein